MGLVVLIRQELRGGSGPQRLIRALGIICHRMVLTFCTIPQGLKGGGVSRRRRTFAPRGDFGSGSLELQSFEHCIVYGPVILINSFRNHRWRRIILKEPSAPAGNRQRDLIGLCGPQVRKDRGGTPRSQTPDGTILLIGAGTGTAGRP